MIKKRLIIGSEGFIGKQFVNSIKEIDDPDLALFMVDIVDINKPNYYKCNGLNFEFLNNLIGTIKPDEIYNFSGSFTNNFDIDYQNNVLISKNIFQSLVQNNLDQCRVLVNGSAAEYGLIKNYNQPVDENSPLNPINYYGLTKVYQTYLAKTYFLRNNVNVIVARPFNIIGYGVSDYLFIGRLMNQIDQYFTSGKKIILGNLENERDYLDIEDLLHAYSLIMKDGTPGEIYNIGSGISIRIQELLDKFLKFFNINMDQIEQKEGLSKKFDVPKIVADISKMKKLKWNVKISLEESIKRIKNRYDRG